MACVEQFEHELVLDELTALKAGFALTGKFAPP
jgi:hypothetical protein